MHPKGSIKRRMSRRSTRCTEIQTGRARRRGGAQPEHADSLDSIPSNSAAQLSTSSLSQAERQSCMPQDVRQSEQLLAEAGMELKLEVLTDCGSALNLP